MRSNKQGKQTNYLLTNHQGIEIYLSVPSLESRDQKYYIEYNSNGRKKYYGQGTVKKRAIQFFDRQKSNNKLKHSQMEFLLGELFEEDIYLIIHEINVTSKTRVISMRSKVKDAIEGFYNYKDLQRQEGTLDKRALGNYGQYHRKILAYLELKQLGNCALTDLSADFWVRYRIDLINNNFGLNTKVLSNATINQHMQYFRQFYGWLIDYLELPIKDHLKKLSKLNESKLTKRFKVIESPTLSQFYDLLERCEKNCFTSLYLSALFTYENNIRLSEQVLIQLQHVDQTRSTVSILNKKNDSTRIIEMSPKAQELFNMIKVNTLKRGFALDENMYVFGGYNRFKAGKPLTYKELGTMMRRFRKRYPQFSGITLYEQKHTSITNQFDAGVNHYQIKERANHSSISTTEIYLQSGKMIKPYHVKIEER